MEPYPVITNMRLLDSVLSKHPEFKMATVCTCGAIFPTTTAAGHFGGSNRKWTVKARFAPKHKVAGYTLMGADE